MLIFSQVCFWDAQRLCAIPQHDMSTTRVHKTITHNIKKCNRSENDGSKDCTGNQNLRLQVVEKKVVLKEKTTKRMGEGKGKLPESEKKGLMVMFFAVKFCSMIN